MMKSPLPRIFLFQIIAFFGIALILSSPASAQWWPDSTRNTPVCDTTGQQDLPQGCSDGANGAIFVWRDARNGTTQIYAQHINAAGFPTWAHNGVRLGTGATLASQTNPVICSDDSGGAYVVWQDSRLSYFGSCLYAQHIEANGTLAYPDSALPVGIGINNNGGLANQTLCDDGNGKAYVAWEDNRSATSGSRPDIYMNRLWTHGVKFGVTTTGTTGTFTLGYKTTHPKATYPAIFHDPNANFQSYMGGLYMNIVGSGTYLIGGIDNDTTLEFKNPPAGALNNVTYSILGPMGLVVDTFANKQTKPVLCNDGSGGAYLAWVNSATSPNSIYATRLDSNGVQLWDPAPSAGFPIYQNASSSSPSKNVSLTLDDNNQLLLAWEVTNQSNSDGQDIYAQRMNNKTIHDTSFAWGENAIQVTGSWPNDQTNPEIFGDDSIVNGSNGAIVPFVDQEPGGGDDYDITMKRILGDGGTIVPQGFWYLDYKPHGQIDFKAVKISDNSPTGAGTGILAVWEDFSSGTDTMIYVQRMDRNGKTYFGTSPTWGLCISGDTGKYGPRQPWTAKQPCIVPRTDGAIVAWTDLRNGNTSPSSVYCQYIGMNGLLWIPHDTVPPVLTVQSATGSFDGSECNTRCYNMLAEDTGALKDGIDTVMPVKMNNMELQATTFADGAASVSFSLCVIDSLQDGSATISVRDSLSNVLDTTFTYCTIPDSNPPVITWDRAQSPYWLNIHLRDDRPWSHGLKSYSIGDTLNVRLAGLGGTTFKSGDSAYDLVAFIIDTLLPGHFIIQASDLANKLVAFDTIKYSPGSAVVQESKDQISISVFPNPTSGGTTIWLDGAPVVDVTVLDVLGRTVEQFRLEGSHEWQPTSLAPGAYTIRAIVGDQVIFKRIVRE